MHTHALTATLFIMSKKCKQAKCPPRVNGEQRQSVLTMRVVCQENEVKPAGQVRIQAQLHTL